MDDLTAAALVQMALEEDERESYDEESAKMVALGALVVLGAEEARVLKASRRVRTYLTRPELIPNPRGVTPWQVLYQSRNDRAYITTMGFDVETFDYILASGFEEVWNTTPIPRTDLPGTAAPRLTARSLDAAGALGLVLHYLSSTMHDISLMQIFALIPSTVSRYIDFSLDVLLHVLQSMYEARIQWPKGGEFEDLNSLVVARHPRLTGAFATADGLNLPVQTSQDDEIENSTYNGWLHEHFVSCVISFASDGTIIWCKINAPGSWHDSRVAQSLYKKLENETPDGYYLVTDTAFPRGTDSIGGKIRAPVKHGDRLSSDTGIRNEALAFDRELLSFRQTAEWGNHGLQGSFGRLRVPLPSEEINATRRSNVLEICFRLFQVRTRLVGINQIRTVYMPIWQDGDQEELWNNFERMLFSEQRKRDRVARFHMIAVEE